MADWNWDLIMAAREGNPVKLKLCLDHGADLEYKDEIGWTAFLWAAFGGCLEVAHILNERGCNKLFTNVRGETALHLAAMYGRLNVTKYLVEQAGISIMIRANEGETPYNLAAEPRAWPQDKNMKTVANYLQDIIKDRNAKLISASRDGNVHDVKIWLGNGADIDYEEYGMTAFMFASREGHLEVTRLLLESNCEKDITDRGGRTALHLAAQYGHELVTKYLVEHGMFSPLVKTHQGKTPYDLANELKLGQYSEVMKYLKSKKADDDKHEDTQKTSIQMQFSDDVVPIEIKLMSDKKSVPLYLNLLESGFEEKRDIRLVIVGKKGSGKTSLVKRLFGVDKSKIPEVTSTNGIEIHRIRCDANTDAGIWNKLDGNIKETDLNERLIKSFDKTLKSQGEEGIDRAVLEGGPWAPPVATKPLVTSRIVYGDADYGDDDFSDDDDANEDEEPLLGSFDLQPNLLLEQTFRDIQTMLKSKIHSYHKNDFATLLLWDFAGDEEFYHTHQTFLSPYSIYLVVAKLDEAQDKEAQDLFRLWMDSIHCYSRLEEDKNYDDSKTTPYELDPPVVIVGTWKDAVTSESGKIENSCRENILKYTKNITEDERRHVRDAVFISNTKDDDSVFQPIRQKILRIARQMRTWNKKYPLKFIQLEKSLQERKKELPVITFQELKQISTKTTKPLNDEELILFLKFHHEIRALVFFEDLPDYIILNTQWLSDAFKSIVTGKNFQSVSIKNQKRWEEFHCKGKLHSEVLEDILQEEENIMFKNNKDHILNVMEKFDIIIRPTRSDRHSADKNNDDENACYYVPCMIKAEPECDIYELFNVTEDNCKKSSWFCFEFRFLPPNLMNHLIASFCREYDIAKVGVTKQAKGQNTEQAERVIALYKGVAIFELQKTTKLTKLLVTKRPNSIQIQIWEFGESASIKRGMYKHIVDFVTDEINKIISTRFKMTNVDFEKRWECGLTKPDSVKGSHNFDEEEITEYYCEPCTSTHKCYGEWLGTVSEGPFDVYKKKPGQKGLVLIVNFLFSGKPNERRGSELDVKNLTDFFKDKLGYQVECQSDMTKTDLQKYLQNFEKNYLGEKAKAYHSFTCVVMSHGDENGIQTLDEHVGNESKRITVKEIQNTFKNKPDGKFNGKPKIFLFQACRGQQKQEKVSVSDCTKSETKITKLESFAENVHSLSDLYTRRQDELSGSSEDEFCSDAIKMLQKLPTDADLIVAYATTPDYISIRHTYKGSYFISAFLYVAKDHYNVEDIEGILRRVRHELATNPEFVPQSGALAGKCQMAMLESTSTKKFFL